MQFAINNPFGGCHLIDPLIQQPNYPYQIFLICVERNLGYVGTIYTTYIITWNPHLREDIDVLD